MSVMNLVAQHYGSEGLTETILRALHQHGVDVEHLSVQDLAPVDELHAGGSPATLEVLHQLHLAEGHHLLDVGSGLGGPARLAAATTAAIVTGVDLTPEFVQTARELTRVVGLDDRVTFADASGARLPFADRSFDAAMMIHVGMNVDDKRSVFTEVHRVLRPGARFCLLEQMRTAPGDLPYPLPWAVDDQYSFVETPEQYTDHLVMAGFTVETTDDQTKLSPMPRTGADRLSPETVFGPEFLQRVRANAQAADDGLLAAVRVVARA